MELPAKTRETFKNKIRNLNSRSQHSTTKDLIDKLGLVLSSREKQAHTARHKSAHGKDDEVDAEWIRDVKLLCRGNEHAVTVCIIMGQRVKAKRIGYAFKPIVPSSRMLGIRSNQIEHKLPAFLAGA